MIDESNRRFLETLFPDLGGGFIEIRTIHPLDPDPQSRFYSSLEALSAEQTGIDSLAKQFHLYFGVCPRSRREGTKAAVRLAWCLWADVDAKLFPGGKAEALKRLREFLLPSTAIVDSGHGFHPYWRLKEPEEIAGPEDVARLEAYLKALAHALGADPSASELARILRLPGTQNLKDPSAPLPVTVVELEPDRQYNLSDFEAFLNIPAGQSNTLNKPGWIAEALSGLTEGNRNSTFARVIGRLHHDGWETQDILTLLTPHAQEHNFSPEELRKEVEGICARYPQPKNAGDTSDAPPDSKRSKAIQLLQLVEAEQLVFFHDQFDEPHTVLPGIDGQILKVRSKAFRRWLAHAAWKQTGQVFSAEQVQAALQILEGKARFEGRRIELQVRVAWHEGALYYDLGDGRAVHITPDGWQVVQRVPILFRRLAHQKPQVTPVSGGDLRLFLTLVNLREDGPNEGRGLLLLVWLVAALVPGFPHPPLVAHGPQGAAKSSLFKLIKELLDPSAIQTLSPADNLRELVLQAAHHWFIPLDNLSSLPEWMSDALSRACTGDGFSKRELFTDTDEVILAFRRIIGVNGINLVVDKPDLLDRSILLGLERIPEDRRMGEADLWDRFNQAKPQLMGAMFDALAKALRIEPDVRLPLLPRMADFAKWGVAVAQALGFQGEDFLSAYRLAIAAQHQEAITASLVAQAVVSLMDERPRWEGKPSELLGALGEVADRLHIDTRNRRWPKDPNWVWRRLREVQTNLEAIGLRIERGEKTDRRIVIQKVSESTVDTVALTGETLAPQHPQQNPLPDGELPF